MQKANKQNTNASGISPTEFNCLVKPNAVNRITKGGIELPEIAIQREESAAIYGTLVACSPISFTYERWPEGCRRPSVGDHVIFAKFAGMKVKGKDGAEYLLVKDKDIAAIIAE